MINNNIQEDYCSFEVSKLLRDRGCKQIATSVYVLDWDLEESPPKDSELRKKINTSTTRSFGDFINDIEKYPNYCGKITHSVAIEWIRVNFGIWINVWSDTNLNLIEWRNSAKWFYVLNCDLGECYDLQTGKHKYLFNSPTEAYEAAIQYTLKNLIP